MDVVSVITELGFPIAAALGLGMFVWKLINRIIDGMESKLDTLDDESTMIVLNNQMSERNLTIDSKVYKYLFKNYSRDLKVLLSVINDLDKLSLQSKQAISIPFVKKTLQL